MVLMALLTTLSGCGNSSVFKSLAGGGQARVGVLGANDALQGGQYASAITNADTVLDDPNASIDDKVQSSLIKGQAILGKADITAAKLVITLEDRPEGATQNILSLFPDMDIEEALLAADALNLAGFDIEPSFFTESLSVQGITAPQLTQNQQMARLIANATVCIKMLTRVYTITDTELTIVEPHTFVDTLEYLFRREGRSVRTYSTAAKVAAPYTGLSPSNLALVDKITTCIDNLGLIKSAYLDHGTAYTYVDGITKTINSNSTEDQVREAMTFEVLRVR